MSNDSERDFLSRPRIGRYRIIETVSVRRQTIVFKANDPDLDRVVSLKIYIDQNEDAPSIERVLKEARALVKIRSPFVARCHNLETINDTPVLVNEWIEGQTLDQYLTSNCLNYVQIKDLFQKIVRGVMAIHDEGILHRDLKPSNIVVSELGEPTIIDLGLAHVNAEPVQDLAGTLSFVSPEVAKKQPAQVGIPTDIFGLGGVLYFMLAGRSLYQSGTRAQLLEMARNCDYQSPNEVVGHPANKLDVISKKCLALEIENRFQSTAELLDAMNAKSLVSRIAVAVFPVLLAMLVCSAFHFSGKWPVKPVESNQSATHPEAEEYVSLVENEVGRLKSFDSEIQTANESAKMGEFREAAEHVELALDLLIAEKTLDPIEIRKTFDFLADCHLSLIHI